MKISDNFDEISRIGDRQNKKRNKQTKNGRGDFSKNISEFGQNIGFLQIYQRFCQFFGPINTQSN